MEADNLIPEFDRLEKALDSGGPFRLTSNAEYSLDEVPEDKRDLFHNALLLLNQIILTIANEEDIQFISNLIKEHQRIDMLDLSIGTDLDISNLAYAIQSSNIGGIELKRDCVSDIAPILMALGKLACLKKFTLQNALYPQEYDALARTIQNEQLEEVSICLTRFPGEVWTSLTPVISAHSTLKTLHLPWNYGGGTRLKAITEIISKNSSIQELTFDDDFFTTANANDTKMLCEALKRNSTLTSLSVSCFEAEETKMVFEVLAHNQVKLSTFKLNQARLNNENLRVLEQSLSTNTTLTVLGFPGCNLSDDACQALCRVLSSNKTIERLELFWSEYEAGGIRPICELVNSNHYLKVLDLSKSTTTSHFEHCKEIAQMLRNNTSLTVLDLSDNFFTDQGADAICEAMVHNSTLKKLMLTSHYPGTFLASNLTDMLAHNKTLRHLQVTVDPAVKESRDLLCEGLAQNDSLTHLDLAFKPNNEMSDGPQLLIQSLVEVLKHNYALTTVSLSQGFRQIERLLQRNRQLKSSIKFLVAILSHNIARSSHALTILPREIWKQILSSITSPGMEPFGDLVEAIFKSYE